MGHHPDSSWVATLERGMWPEDESLVGCATPLPSGHPGHQLKNQLP